MQINTREYQIINNLNEELTIKLDKNYLFSLEYLSTISATGENPAKYLQGQLTCDLNKINQQNMQPGAICNLQGRIIALLNVILWNKVHYLILPKDLQEKTQKTLHKTAIFSKVKITKLDEFNIFGFYFQNPDNVIPFSLPKNQYEVITTAEYCCYKLATNLYVIITQPEFGHKLLTNFPTQQLRKDLAWHTLLLNASIYEIYPTSSGLFLPHRLGLHKTAYLSFTKGCFIGQEIIARTQYLAKLKHDMYLYKIQTNETLFSGQKIYNPETKQEIGELIDYTLLATNNLNLNNLSTVEIPQYLVACSLLLASPTIVKFAEHSKVINFTD